MGVSFKVAKVGTRYKPKLVQIEDKAAENPSANDPQQRNVEGNLSQIGAEIVHDSNKKDKSALHSMLEELEVSFSLNLFKDGFSIGKAIEFLSEIPKQLHPYDKASEALFSAIEHGWLPGEMLGDIPCKYVNGALMCEIRDYRDILPYKGCYTSPTGNSPIVHKMILQLCMETVVKDILSISNDSWTYKDLLEIESCITKALQPDLHLNPEPLWDKFFGEAPRKKIDLGIAWSWKKRKLGDIPTHSLPIGNSNLVNHTMGDCLIQKSKPQSGPVEKDRRTASIQENISSCSRNPQGINFALDSSSPSYALVVHKTHYFGSVPNQLFTNVNPITPAIPVVPSEKGICDKEDIKGLIFKKPKQEPVDLPKLQLLGSQFNIAPKGPELQRMDNVLQQQPKVDKILCKNKKSKMHFPPMTHDDQMIVKGMQNVLTRVPSVKQEPVETSDLHTDYLCMDRRTNQSNLYNSKQQIPSMPLGINSSSIHIRNRIAHPSDKYLKNGTATQKKKNSQNPQIIAAVGSLSATSRNSNSSQRQAPISTGQKNSRPKGLQTEMADSVVSMSSMNMTNANNPTVKNFPLPQPSTGVNIAVERLLKILGVSERHGLTNRKRKLDQFVGRKMFFGLTPPLVGYHLASFENSGKSEDSTGYKGSRSKYSNDWKTRTLIFSHEPHMIQRSDSPMVDREGQIKLVMLENLDSGTIAARVYYGCEGENSISFPLLTTFPCTHSMEQIASQFTSLMVREGYRIISDQVGSSPCNKDGESGIEKPIVSNAISTSGTVKPSPTWTTGLSSLIQHSSSIGMPFHNPTQLPLPITLSGVNFTTSGNSHSLPQLTQSCSSKPQFDNLQQQVMSMQHWWQLGANKLSWLKVQMQVLRHRQELELLSRKESMVDLGAAVSGQDTVPINDGIQRMRNINTGSCSNIMGNNGSAPVVSGGLVHWPSSLSTFNNLENHTLGLNDKQLFGALSGGRLPSSPKLSTSQDLGRSSISGLPTWRNTRMSAVAIPDALDMKYMLNNQQQQTRAETSWQSLMRQEPRSMPYALDMKYMSNNQRQPWAEISWQSHMIQQQELRSILQPQGAANLADGVASPLCPVNSLQGQQPQLSRQQLNPMSAFNQMNAGNISGSGRTEVSS